ncbi:hypothetical protein PG994_003586 [Apiospora phragmitis]|uniref:Beta-xylanase n=1 Tax=Apiospora phragmitis TaxID=2905665 RepID=A0ABR1VYL6_9PEZI
MKATTIACLLGPAGILAAPAVVGRAAPSQSINDLFKAKGKLYYGNIADPQSLGNSQTTDILKAGFGQLTAENSRGAANGPPQVKWDATEPSRGSFSFSGSDQVANFATSNGMLIRGHTPALALPDPAVGAADQRPCRAHDGPARPHQRCCGTVQGQSLRLGRRQRNLQRRRLPPPSVWSNVLGEDFVRIAFEAARAADPAAKLYINDYNLDSASYAKLTNGMVAHVKKWLAAGVPIDGIGTQSHLGAGASSGTQGALEALAGSGVSEVAITELDIAGAAANDYVAVTNACLAVEKCVGITVWGVTDTQSWRSDENPTLFDGSYNEKAAYGAIVQALS